MKRCVIVLVYLAWNVFEGSKSCRLIADSLDFSAIMVRMQCGLTERTRYN